MSSTGHPLPQIFDYIVVGGGTAGPVVARRLADGDATAKVLLLEAGPTQDGIINSHMPMGWQNIHGSVHDWGYHTVPQKHANNRVIRVPRGKFLGGCSGMNGTLIIRGSRADYDKWADAGCDGWGWDNVLPYFTKFETFHPSPDLPASSYHGSSGPVHTTFHPPAPISEAVLHAFVEKGFEYKPDMFAEGESEGVGHAARTVHEGIRTTAAAFVDPSTIPRNLTVLTSMTALRILLSDYNPSTTPHATAVEAFDSIKGIQTVLHARREIILCAGAYNSPALLMHSGIGPRGHLAEVGIDCIVDLPGVGSNLQDHLIGFAFYQLHPGLTYDNLVYPPGTLERSVAEWIENRTGVMSRFPFGPFAYKRMNDIMKDTDEWREAQVQTRLLDPTGRMPTQPHIEYFNTELYGGGPQFTDLPRDESQSAFAMITMLCGPQSRGTVHLASSDPHMEPVIDHAYLSSQLDVAVLAEGMRLADAVVREGSTTKDHIIGAWPPGSALPDAQDAGAWREYARANAGTCYHPSGTCKMGPGDDVEAVVDPRLRVRGVGRLRVADCSIMPWINSGHTQAPAYMIGEKCADLILEDHSAQLEPVGFKNLRRASASPLASLPRSPNQS